MTEDEKQTEEDRGTRQRMGDGIRSGIGVLSAFKDALEETIKDARDRGDLSAERAKELMKEALEKAQSAASGARERLDFVHQTDFDELKKAVEALNERVIALEGRLAGSQAEDDQDQEEGGA
jgi:polyhydroxyalkanoate synthesis regulator phasin